MPHSRQAKISFRDVNIGFMETALLKINCNNQVAILGGTYNRQGFFAEFQNQRVCHDRHGGNAEPRAATFTGEHPAPE